VKTARIIEALGALAHEHRLAIYRLLVAKGPEGLAAGNIADRIGIIPSTLTFHLQNLQRAGLITQRRDGRQLIYAADFPTMNELVGYLTDNCCAGSQECAPECAPARPAARSARRPTKAA
jgi:ArsR family transcriptional regulator, arsenate/arsenite/antimonite-responsive transcriptional repressor